MAFADSNIEVGDFNGSSIHEFRNSSPGNGSDVESQILLTNPNNYTHGQIYLNTVTTPMDGDDFNSPNGLFDQQSMSNALGRFSQAVHDRYSSRSGTVIKIVS